MKENYYFLVSKGTEHVIDGAFKLASEAWDARRQFDDKENIDVVINLNGTMLKVNRWGELIK